MSDGGEDDGVEVDGSDSDSGGCVMVTVVVMQ